MNTRLAPEHILRAALRVVHFAAFTTRNWALAEDISRKQIYDLWEAVHPIPELLNYWRDDQECLQELRGYLREYDRRWNSPKLEAVFDDALGDPTNLNE